MRERTMSTPPGWPPVPPGGAYLLSALFTYHRGGGEGIVQLNDSESGQPIAGLRPALPHQWGKVGLAASRGRESRPGSAPRSPFVPAGLRARRRPCSVASSVLARTRR